MKRIDRDKVAPGVAAVGTLAVGGLAFALSFTALSELAAANGVAQAEMVPLVVDSSINGDKLCFLLTSIVHSTDKNRERKRQRPKSSLSAPVVSFLFRGYFK